MSQRLKELSEVVTYIRTLERRIDELTISVNDIKEPKTKSDSVKSNLDNMTLKVERHLGYDVLVAVDGSGWPTPLATFNTGAAATFKSAYEQAISNGRG